MTTIGDYTMVQPASVNVRDRRKGRVGSSEAQDNVPLQVMVSPDVKRQIAHMCAERGESLRTVVLRGLMSIGVDVPEEELGDRRGRRKI
jgi:hypothetical protein